MLTKRLLCGWDETLSQRPDSLQLLPVGEIKGVTAGVHGHNEPEKLLKGATEFLFEPSPDQVLGELLPHYINFQVYQILLEAKASEQSARMVAMKNATDNAKQLIKDLTLEYNKLRQANITKELLEITTAQGRCRAPSRKARSLRDELLRSAEFAGKILNFGKPSRIGVIATAGYGAACLAGDGTANNAARRRPATRLY